MQAMTGARAFLAGVAVIAVVWAFAWIIGHA
jgi:hypothetical protein